MLLSKLKSTGDCIILAKTLTIEQAVELKRLRELCIISSDKWMDKEFWNITSLMATKAQFCREAIQFSIHAEVFNLKPLTDLREKRR